MFCGLAAVAEEKDNILFLFIEGLLTWHSIHNPVYFLFSFPSNSNIYFFTLFNLEHLI